MNLPQALAASAASEAIEFELVSVKARSWRSPTFIGSRDLIDVRVTGSCPAIDGWVDRLPSSDLNPSNAIIADIAVVARTADRLTIEALLIHATDVMPEVRS